MNNVERSVVTRTASFEATLVMADYPVLILLKRSGKGAQYFFASAVADDDGDLDHFVAVSAQPKSAKDYFRGRCDLRFLFVYAPGAIFYKIDKDTAFSKSAKLVELQGEIPDSVIPDQGFFSKFHTREYLIEDRPPSTKTIPIDGVWKMEELREIYSRYADLYAFAEAVDEIRTKRREDIGRRYVNAFHSKPFKGGSSYLGFFDDLKAALPPSEKPSLQGVNWNSPGKIIIRGTDDLFANVDSMITSYMENSKAVKDTHKKLRDLMTGLGLLDITARTYTTTPKQIEEIRELTSELLSALSVPGGPDVLKVLDGDAVVGAKIALAVFRRISTTAEYFMEGRAAF